MPEVTKVVHTRQLVAEVVSARFPFDDGLAGMH